MTLMKIYNEILLKEAEWLIRRLLMKQLRKARKF